MLQRRISPAKRYLRRTLQVVALVGTILVGIVALALIVSQTPWFKDWLRRFVVREGSQYLNGTLSIGSLGGDLFYGVQLGDVAVDVNGQRVITLKKLELTYRLTDLISNGMTVQQIRLEQPFILLRHDASGWNVANLVKKQSQEASRQGPGKPLSLPDIEIADGRAVIDDEAPSTAYRLPSRIDGLNAKAGFEYAPVHYSLTLDRLAFAGRSPSLTVTNLTGRVGTRDDDLHVEKLALATAASEVTIDGVVRDYLQNRSLQVTVSSPGVSLPELSGVLPVLAPYRLHPSIDLKADGSQADLRLTIDERSEAGAVSGTATVDAKAPGFGVRGDLNVRNLNLAPLLNDPARKSDVTGHTVMDLRVASGPSGAPVLERTHGTFRVDAPEVAAAGYRASDVRVTGAVDGRRVSLDARADAYGGAATVTGVVVAPATTGGPVQFDVSGSASHLDLRNLPAAANAPRVATNLNATAFHAKGEAGRARTAIGGDVTMGQSTVAGGTIVDGTTATFRYVAAGGRHAVPDVRYTARGGVRDVNIYTMGQAFRVPALAKPAYDSRVNADFSVAGTGTAPATMKVDATATVTTTRLMGGSIPRLGLEAHVADGGVQGRANGELRGFDPARISGRPAYQGSVNATVDASFGLKDISRPVTPDAVTVDGRVTLGTSEIGGLRIDSADVEGSYANLSGEIRAATVKGPDVDVQASGPIALDRAGSSNVKYHVEATDLAQIGRLVNAPISGAATVDGTVTGNAASLQASGTLDGSDLAYKTDKALDLNSQFTATVPDLTFARARVQAQTRSTFLEAAGLHINELQATTTYEDRKLDFQTHVVEAPAGAEAEKAAGRTGEAASATRELDAIGSVVFHPDHQEIHLPSLSLRTQGIEWKTAPGSDAAIQYGNNRVQVQNIRLVNGSQSLDVAGVFSTGDTPAPATLTVRAQSVDLSQIDKLALLNRGISGTLNANATLTGTASAPAIDGHLEIANGGFQQFKYQSLVTDATYARDTIRLDARLVQTPGVELTANGVVPMSAVRPNPPGVTGHVEPMPGDALDVRIQSSRIDLGIVQGFTSQVTNVTGTLQADVRVTGSGEDPHLNGYVALDGGAFAVPGAGTSFSGLTTRVELQTDRVHVPRFQVLDEHGDPLTIQGDLAVHERRAGAVNVSIESDNFKLMDNELGDVHVESHLKLTGAVRRPRIEGDIRADQARLEVDRILLLLATPYSERALPPVRSAEETATTDKGAEQATRDAFARGRAIRARERGRMDATAPRTGAPRGPMRALALNVHLVAPDNMVVRGQDLRPAGPAGMQVGNVNATVGADLQIQKEPRGPITLRGTVDTVRGFYEFQGRRFEVVRGGTVQFIGLPQVDPNLDVSATRVIPDSGVTAELHVTGTMRAPELALTSDPPLDEADILSLIIFNRNVNELGTGERASLAETAGGIASGFVAAPLSRSIGKALDVDLFEITTSDPQTGETAGGVTLGKQVSDKAFIKYRQQFGSRSAMEFMLEYDLARFLRLQTNVAPETSAAADRLAQRRVERAGIDLIFFFSY